MKKPVKELKRGEFFTRKETAEPDETKVWIRGEYDRSSGKYECWCWADVNRVCYLKGATIVYTDFTF